MSVTLRQVPPCAWMWPSLDCTPSFTVGASPSQQCPLLRRGLVRLGTRDSDVMRGQAVMGHSRHRRGGGRQVAAVAEGGMRGSGPLPTRPPPPPAHEKCRGPRLGNRRCPPRGTSPYKRTGLALKSQICEVAKIVAAVPTFRTQENRVSMGWRGAPQLRGPRLCGWGERPVRRT